MKAWPSRSACEYAAISTPIRRGCCARAASGQAAAAPPRRVMKSRRLTGSPFGREAEPYHILSLKAVLCITAKSSCPRHLAALPRTAGRGRQETLALQNGPLFDDLVGAHQERGRNGDPEGFRDLEVDGQLDLGGLLHRQVSWLLAVEDSTDVGPGDTMSLG